MTNLNDWLQNASSDVRALNQISGMTAVTVQDFDGRSPNKYNAQKVEIDGVTFDSKKEARRYLQLKALAAAGEISGLELQPEFELLPAFRDVSGKKHRAIKYRADFRYRDNNGSIVIEDTKGHETAVFKLKRKMFLHRYDYELRLT